MTWGILVLAALSSYRLTRLVTADELTEPFRHWVLLRYPPRQGSNEDDFGRPIAGTARFVPSVQVQFVNCAWCVGVWMSLAVLVVVHFLGLLNSWQLLAIAWLAVATVVGLVARIGG